MECVNCSEGFNTVNRIPRLLTNCGHSICETCLMQYWNHQEYIYICRACSTLNKAETISLFPKNQAILSLTQFQNTNNQNVFKSSQNTSSQSKLDLLLQRDFANQSIQSHNISHNQSIQQQYYYQNNQANPSQIQNIQQNNGQINRLSLNNTTTNSLIHHGNSTSNGQLKGIQVQLVLNNNEGNDNFNNNINTNNNNLNQQNTCQNHNKQYEAFCLQDKQFLCIQCILDNNSLHKNHQIETIEKAVSIEMSEIHSFQLAIHSKSQSNTDTLNKIETLKSEILLFEQKQIEQISSFYSAILKLVQERQQNIMDKLQSEKQKRIDQLNEINISVLKCFQDIEEFNEASKKLDISQFNSMNYKQYLEKTKDIQQLKTKISMSEDYTEELKRKSESFKPNNNNNWNFEFNTQVELSIINKILLDNNPINNISNNECTPNNAANKTFTISLSKERIHNSSNNQNNISTATPGSNGKHKNTVNISSLTNTNQSKKQIIYPTRNQRNIMNDSYNNTSLQHDMSLNIIEKERENSNSTNLYSQQQQQQQQQQLQRKHSKTLQATTLNSMIQQTTPFNNQPNNSSSQTQINKNNISNSISSSSHQTSNQNDFQKYKIEITNIKMLNRQSSQPKKQSQNNNEIPTYKKENINQLNIITSHQNPTTEKQILYLENRSNKNLLLSSKSVTNQSNKNINTLKYKSLRSQNPCNITSYGNNLYGNEKSSNNNNNSIDKMKVLRGSTSETVKNSTRHTMSVNNQLYNKQIQQTINTDISQNNIFNERDLQTTRTIESSKLIDFDSDRNIIDTVKIDFSSLASQKRQFIFTLGGFTEKQSSSYLMEKLDLQSNVWEPYQINGNIKQKVKFGSVVYKSKKLIIFGGKQEGKRVDTFEEIDIQSKEHKIIPSLRLLKPKSGFAYTQISDDEIIVVGGNDGNNILNDVEIYNLNTKQIKKLSPLIYGRDELAIALSNDKKYIYAFGGYSQTTKGSLNVVEKYDIQKNKWEIIKSMNQCRRSLQAVTLPDGFYILGGFDGQNYLNSVEKYDDVNDSWISISNMTTPRATFSAIKSPDNMGIIVLGGFNNSPLSTCEKFSIFKGTWENFPSLSQKRFMHSSILFCNNNLCY